jgi:hypothetical protein
VQQGDQDEADQRKREAHGWAQQPGDAAEQRLDLQPGTPGYGFTQEAVEAGVLKKLRDQVDRESLAEANDPPQRYRALFVIRVVPGPIHAGTAARLADQPPPAAADAAVMERGVEAAEPAAAPEPVAPTEPAEQR